MKKRILIVVGTRPNFVKITQFKKIAAQYDDLDLRIVHTGQHHDEKMSDVFLQQFQIKIDYFLGIKNMTPNSLIGEIILKLESVIENFKPNLLLCVGDVNSTLAAAICANKLCVKLGHIESGLRSFDREMPEEINRILTDEISDLCFVTEKSGIDNLKKIGKTNQQIAFVGNTMIDTLVSFKKEIEASTIIEDIKVEKHKYLLITIHRPRNVDTKAALEKIISLFKNISQNNYIVFSIHPRTQNSFKKFDVLEQLQQIENLKIIAPQNYFSFQKLIKYASCVITDSGGIQEETTFQKIPCITLRNNTERPSTLTEGTNQLLPFDVEQVAAAIENIATSTSKKATIPKFWDGNATERILKKSLEFLA